PLPGGEPTRLQASAIDRIGHLPSESRSRRSRLRRTRRPSIPRGTRPHGPDSPQATPSRESRSLAAPAAARAPRAATRPRRGAAGESRGALWRPFSNGAWVCAASFDNLIGAQDEPRRNLVPDRLSGLEIDDQLEPGRLFDGQIDGLAAAQDLDD